ncbi:MAG: hypothetical protein U1E76_18295 [Planctomycetota bacterium]
MRRVESLTAGQNLLTPHDPARYPGLTVVRLMPHHRQAFICPQDGQVIAALGGERIYGYQTQSGARAQGFTLRPGDRAQRVRSGLPCSLCEWHIERA